MCERRTRCKCSELIRNSAALLDTVAENFTDPPMKAMVKLRAEIYRDVAESLDARDISEMETRNG